jgi:hypothetical protein
MIEAGVILVDDALRDDGCNRLLHTLIQEFVLQTLCDLQADGSLRISNTIRERYLVDDIAREFRAQQDEANLRTIAVRYENPVALLDERHDVVRGFACRTVLIKDAHVFGVRYQ